MRGSAHGIIRLSCAHCPFTHSMCVIGLHALLCHAYIRMLLHTYARAHCIAVKYHACVSLKCSCEYDDNVELPCCFVAPMHACKLHVDGAEVDMHVWWWLCLILVLLAMQMVVLHHTGLALRSNTLVAPMRALGRTQTLQRIRMRVVAGSAVDVADIDRLLQKFKTEIKADLEHTVSQAVNDMRLTNEHTLTECKLSNERALAKTELSTERALAKTELSSSVSFLRLLFLVAVIVILVVAGSAPDSLIGRLFSPILSLALK